MSSVIASARQSTTSVFSVITRSAETLTNLLDAAALSADILTHKARVLNHGAITQAKADMFMQEDEIILTCINRHVDLLEDSHKRNFPAIPFDRATVFNDSLKALRVKLAA